MKTLELINKDYEKGFRKIKIHRDRKSYLKVQTDRFLRNEMDGLNKILSSKIWIGLNGEEKQLTKEDEQEFRAEWAFITFVLMQREEVRKFKEEALNEFKKLNDWDSFLSNYKA